MHTYLHKVLLVVAKFRSQTFLNEFYSERVAGVFGHGIPAVVRLLTHPRLSLETDLLLGKTICSRDIRKINGLSCNAQRPASVGLSAFETGTPRAEPHLV